MLFRSDLQPANSRGGENYGWNKWEGLHCYPESARCDPTGFVAPIGEYAHGGGDCSITGGYVYRGTVSPALTGWYIFGDFCTGRLWGLRETSPNNWTMTQAAQTGLGISSFGEDQNGEVYVVDYNGGALYRVTAH